MILLLNCHLLGGWPKHVAAEVVGPNGGDVLLGLLPAAVGAVVVGADWMESVRMAVGAHVQDFLQLGLPALPMLPPPPLALPLGSRFSLLVIFKAMAAMVPVSFFISTSSQFFLHLHVADVVCRIGCTRAC